MEQIQVFFLLTGVLILTVASEPTSLEYHFISHSMSWDDAQNYCRIKHWGLASVLHNESHLNIEDLLEPTGAQSSWIGLRRTDTRQWRWSDGSGTLQYESWASGAPDNVGGNEWCVEISSDGTWNDIYCSDVNKYICYDLNGDGQETFHYYGTLENFEGAQEKCQINHIDLVAVKSFDINSEIKALVPWGFQAWIGLFNDAWEWSAGSVTSYRSWAEVDEGEGSCAAIQLDGLMTAADCEETKPFVCEGGLKTQKTLVKITLSTTADLRSTTYNFNILQHLHKLLKANRVSDFKLHWRRGKDRKVFRQQATVADKETTCEDVQA